MVGVTGSIPVPPTIFLHQIQYLERFFAVARWLKLAFCGGSVAETSKNIRAKGCRNALVSTHDIGSSNGWICYADLDFKPAS
jgi:hypothetical protein